MTHTQPMLQSRTAVVLAATSLLVATLAAGASAARRVPVLTRKGVGEFQPAAGNGYLGWEQVTRARPKWFNVFARRGRGRPFKINAPGTQGAMGGIEGNLIVYQQYRGTRSDIKFYNLSSRRRSSPQIFVNTPNWEYWPSVSGDWILFGRLNLKTGSRKIILYNRATISGRIIDQTTRRRHFISPGQVNGDFVVWHRCIPLPNCNVYRYNIRTRLTDRIPNPRRRNQHAASVASDGTVYFASSGRKLCGANVRLMRYPVGGPPAVLGRMGRGIDSGDSFAMTDGAGNRHFLFERHRCNRDLASDIFKIVD